jgi:DNA-binding GntR family transcriptional regulator
MPPLRNVPHSVRLQHSSKADQVADTLRRMVLSRELEPGRRVTQAELADMLGVSTMPVREALLRLVAEGFVDALTSRSFTVADSTRERIQDIYWTHGMLIGEMTARAWDQRDESLLTTLKVLHSDFLVGLRRHSGEQMLEANLAVYSALETAARSPGLAFMLRTTLRYFPDFSASVPGYTDIGTNWHAGLIDEFTNGTREGARQVTMDAVRAATDFVMRSFWGFDVASAPPG